MKLKHRHLSLKTFCGFGAVSHLTTSKDNRTKDFNYACIWQMQPKTTNNSHSHTQTADGVNRKRREKKISSVRCWLWVPFVVNYLWIILIISRARIAGISISHSKCIKRRGCFHGWTGWQWVGLAASCYCVCVYASVLFAHTQFVYFFTILYADQAAVCCVTLHSDSHIRSRAAVVATSCHK